MLSDWPDGKAELIHRLHCAEGHLCGIAVMVERSADCQSVIHQMLAVQAALREINRLVMKHHLTVCLNEHVLSKNADATTREQFLAEVISLYHLLGGSQPPLNQKELQ